MAGDSDEKRRRRRRKLGALALFLLTLLGLLTWAAVEAWLAQSRVANPNAHCCALYDATRAQAQYNGLAYLTYQAALLTDTTNATRDAMVAQFEAAGTLSTATGNYVGAEEIGGALDAYVASGYQYNMTLTVHRAFWDYAQSELSVEYSVAGLTGDDRLMYDDDLAVTSYPVDTPFEQDRAAVFLFDCQGLFVYLRAYYNPLQRVTTFTEDAPPVCNRCSCEQVDVDVAQLSTMRAQLAQLHNGAQARVKPQARTVRTHRATEGSAAARLVRI